MDGDEDDDEDEAAERVWLSLNTKYFVTLRGELLFLIISFPCLARLQSRSCTKHPTKDRKLIFFLFINLFHF